jgi:hypothetical protein
MRRVVLALFGYGLAVGCFPSGYVTHPELEVAVVDAAGAPIADAEVVAYSWSDPHSRLDHERAQATDAKGMVRTDRESRDEWLAPFCIHGVPAHYLTVCVGKAGYTPVYFGIADGDRPTTVTVTLRTDASATGCSFAQVEGPRASVVPRADVSAANVVEPYESPIPSASAAASAPPGARPSASVGDSIP